MKTMLLIGALLVGTQAFGLTLAPGESIEWGHTVITCSDSSSELPRCKLVNSGVYFDIYIGDVRINGGFSSDRNAVERIKAYREAGLCR